MMQRAFDSIAQCLTRRDALGGTLGSALLVLAAVGGCGEAPATDQTDAPALDRAITRTAEADAVDLKLTVAPGDLPFSQKATIVIELDAPVSSDCRLDDYASQLAASDHQFELEARLVDRKEQADESTARKHLTARYELSFVLPGEYELPGASATVSPGANPQTVTSAADDQANTLSTEPITVIAEATDAANLTAEQLADIKVLRPVEMEEPTSYWTWAAAAGVATAAVLATMLLRRKQKQAGETIVRIPAHEWAHAQLAELLSEDLLGRSLIQEFHYRISDILRGYIERRYGVQALEMTTEEFLEAAARDGRFDSDARGELDRFLHACDLVKYAKQRATSSDGEALAGTTRNFVERTRERYVQLDGDEGENTGAHPG